MGTIIALRLMGVGDILYAEPTLNALSKNHSVSLKTFPKYISIFDNHPSLNAIAIPKINWELETKDVTFDLNWVYEGPWLKSFRKDRKSKTPNLMQCAFEAAVEKELLTESEVIPNPRPKIYLSEEEKNWAKNILPDSTNWIVVDVGYMVGPKSRRQHFESDEWNDLFDALRFMGFKIITIGQGMQVTDLHPDMEMRRKTTLRQFFALMERGNYFLGIESGALATAIAFDKPGVWLAGITPAYALLPANSKIKVVRVAPEIHGGFYLGNHARLFQQLSQPMPGDEVLNVFSEFE